MVTRAHFRIAITLGLVVALAGVWLLQKTRASASAMQKNRITAVRAQLSDTVAVHAARRGFPYVNLSDGHELLASFDSDSEAAARLLATQTNGLTPLAMTSADLDEDGVADLICSYDSPGGAFIAVYRGNVDAIFPNSAAAQQRRAAAGFTNAPFLAPARVFAVPVAGGLLVAGDVNGDAHPDIVITARASRSLYVMAGDGRGSLQLAKEVALPGTVTALAAGDVNRRDGITDILVGVVGNSGPRALVFEGKRGAFDAAPEVFALPDAASEFAIGQFDHDPAADIAIAAGRSLLVIYGRDRQLLVDGARADVRQATTGQRDFSFHVRAITSGKFGDDLLSDIGLLADDGAMYILRVKAQKPNRKAKKRAPQWAIERLSAKAQSSSAQLWTARVSSLPADAMLLLDAGGHQLRIIETGAAKSGAPLANHNATVDLDVEGEAIAALPMRLNMDALDDLVILRQGAAAPTILTSAPTGALQVTNNGDNGGVDPMPGVNTGTLRQALVDANASAGPDFIEFQVGSGLQTIALLAPLPVISESVSIDATTQPGFSGTPLIELNGLGAGPGANGLDIQTNNVVVRALIINRFDAVGILITNNGNNCILTGNRIGTNASGSANLGNGFDGIRMFDSSNCQIGGTAAGAGNLISGNGGSGLTINSVSTGNQVQGNFIGTDAGGTLAIGNTNAGILIATSGTTIGGTAAGSRNLISGNNGRGIFFQGSPAGTLIQGNRIGTQVTGTSALPNTDGVGFGDSTGGVTIGGTSAGAGNTIAFNTNVGVNLGMAAGSSNAILGNSIFANSALGIDMNSDGVTPNDACDADTGSNNLQNFPLITAATAGPTPTVQGTLNSTAGATFRLEFFKNAACDASGNGQGQSFIGSTNVTTNPACTATFNVTLSVALVAGDVVTATATDAASNTSEFSPCFTVMPAAASASLSLELDAMPNPVQAGDDLTYMILVTNGGPDPSVNVTLSEAVPANTTFKLLSAPPGWNCTTPAVGSTGSIICTNPSLAAGANAMFTIVVNVNPGTPPGTLISFTTNLDSSTPDPDTSNNSDTITVQVAGGSCTIACPANLTVNGSPAQCGATVNYSPPTPNGSCGAVTCTPPSGAFFPLGSSNVTCTIVGGPSCSFIVRVVDNTPPVISCPFPITVPTARDKNFAVVDYPIATATDACGVADVVCLPPSGSTFPLGTATVNCTARDVTNNTASCSFTVTVNDADAPVIRCPNNITMELSPAQTSAVVNYPPPTATDNLPGVVATCAPPSGSTFPLGVSTVVCVAIDVTGNRATCGFSISLTGGPPNLEVIIPTGKPALEFGTNRPTPVTRKNKNRARGPCAAFTVVNRSFSRLDLTLDAIQRIGSDVDSGHISDAREGDTYSLSVVGTDGLETPLEVGETVSLPVSGRVNFCLRFSPVLPAVAGGNTQLRAPQAIPDLVNSRVTFRVAGGSRLSVNVNAIVETALHLINPNNPKKTATLAFTKSGDEFSVTFAVHDANNDVSRARDEFLDAGGVVIAGPFDVDLAQAIRERNLVRGQSFTVTQRFTGANSNRQVSAVRVTVFDGETNVTSPTVVLDTSATAVVQAASRLRFMPVLPPSVRMNSPLP
jgi:uncharacterized repeat protein (TIGR01451 family)